MKRMFLLLACAFALAGCRREDRRDFTLHIPKMTPADRVLIEGAISRYGGIDKTSYVYDAEARTLTLRYDSMQLAKKNIEIAIARAGFAVNGVTPESVGATSRR